jgi:hypothetical protein
MYSSLDACERARLDRLSFVGYNLARVSNDGLSEETIRRGSSIGRAGDS